MASVSWSFEVVKASGKLVPLYPTIEGSLSFDTTRDVRRTIGGQMLLPAEARKISLVSDEIVLYMTVDGVRSQMGIFRATESTRQPDTIIDPETGETADLLFISWSDRMIRLRASTGIPETLYEGADPAQELERILDENGLSPRIAGAAAPTAQILTWDGGTTAYNKVEQLAELAGHRPPWPDVMGVIRSIAANEPLANPPVLEKLRIVADSISITENYLTAPNRVIVTDNGGSEFPISGQWDAPASAPHSEAKRGYVLTEFVLLQGLSSQEHANKVAATIGEQFTARTLSCELSVPTTLFDGPIVFTYDGAAWLLESWDIDLGAGSTMNVNAIEQTGIVL